MSMYDIQRLFFKHMYIYCAIIGFAIQRDKSTKQVYIDNFDFVFVLSFNLNQIFFFFFFLRLNLFYIENTPRMCIVRKITDIFNNIKKNARKNKFLRCSLSLRQINNMRIIRINEQKKKKKKKENTTTFFAVLQRYLRERKKKKKLRNEQKKKKRQVFELFLII